MLVVNCDVFSTGNYRPDGKCGPLFGGAECDPNSEYWCCSEHGFCGGTQVSVMMMVSLVMVVGLVITIIITITVVIIVFTIIEEHYITITMVIITFIRSTATATLVSTIVPSI